MTENLVIFYVPKFQKKNSKYVEEKIIELLCSLPKCKSYSITPDRGKYFSKHLETSQKLKNIPFYFPVPHVPRQRETNENTNDLIREYIMKNINIDDITDEQIKAFTHKLNTRPRKRFNWKTPHEIFNHEVLHLI